MKSLEICVREEIAHLKDKIDQGKGTWNVCGYIPDAHWVSMHDRMWLLKEILQHAGLEV